MARREVGRSRAARVDLATAQAQVEALDALIDFVGSVYAIGAADVSATSRRPSPAPPPPSGRGRRRVVAQDARDQEAQVASDLEGFFDRSAAHVRLLGGGLSQGQGPAPRTPSGQGHPHPPTA